jgi:cell division septum initiation protein DivIVA
MATKKLRVENELLRSEIEELKSQLLYKINEDLKTQTTAASKSSRTAEAKEAKEAKDTIERTNSEHRIKISNRRAIQRCNVSSFFYENYSVYWPEGGAASQYSVFIGQKMSWTG